jgi:DNA helicase-2/ATP-dependent DNA helicase PcrA
MDLARLLSPPQFEAATRLDAPVCILAGAGSGKTRVITHRIAWLITEKRVWPSRILAVTFTNKAAAEMRERVARLVPNTNVSSTGNARGLLMGTFHGLSARLLRSYGDLVGVAPGFVIYDADDADRLLARVVTGELNLEKDKAKGIGYLIDSWQSAGLYPADVPKSSDLLFESALKAYDVYLNKLKEARAVDFNGLLLKLRELVTGPNAEAVTQRIQHVLVDEYQDVNQVQADIVLALAKKAASTAVVGDDDQAIYGWRGASADNLKKFLVALPGAVVVKLEENYRSTPAILEAANGIIENNTGRLGKVLVAARTDLGRDINGVTRGRLVKVVKARDDMEEARRVGNLLIEHVAAGVHLDEIAILYRTNAHSRLFEDELRRHSLPYRVVGGVRFYDRKEVKDVLATLRLCFNRKSDVDGLRFLAAVPRGIGAATITKVEEAARRAGQSLFEAMSSAHTLTLAGLTGAGQTKCMAVVKQLDELALKIGRPRAPDPQPGLWTPPPALGAKDAIALAIAASGLPDRLEAEDSEEARGRLENLEELVNAAALFESEATRAGDVGDVEAFLEATALLQQADEDKDEAPRGKVTLMSLHAAKGLEFQVVFLAGLEEYGFPHARALLDDADGTALEEERRLAYVGITRAKDRLVLSWAQRRMVNGITKMRDPSRFLFEVPRTVLEGDVPRRSGGDRDSLLDLWRDRRTAERLDARGSGSGGGFFGLRRAAPAVDVDVDVDVDDNVDVDVSARDVDAGRVVVYDDAPPPPKKKVSKTRLIDVDDASDDVGVDAGLAVTFDDAPTQRPARRFALPAATSTTASTTTASTTTTTTTRDDGGDDVFSAGDRVFHRHFGDGAVVGVRGAGRLANVLVRFDAERAPRLIASRHLKPASSS